MWVNILVAIGLVLFLLLLFVLSLNWMTNHGVARPVPSVVGKKLSEVNEQLGSAGFDVQVQDSVYYDSLPPEVVIRQVPEPDAVVKVNRTIYVIINRVVPPDVAMPNLVGYSIRNAEMTLKNMGLKLGDTTFKPDFARNSVLEQLYNGATIAPGTKIRVGSAIGLVLGSGVGSDEMEVPALSGLTFSEAKVLLEAQGLVLGSVIPSAGVTDQESAFVIRQDPSPRDYRGRRYKIRSGQMINVWLDVNMPVRDTTSLQKAPPQPPVINEDTEQ